MRVANPGMEPDAVCNGAGRLASCGRARYVVVAGGKLYRYLVNVRRVCDCIDRRS